MTSKPRNSLGHSTNLVGLPTDILGSLEFNDHPPELHISGVREMNRPLFDMLARTDDPAEAGSVFQTYMGAMFRTNCAPLRPHEACGRYRASYLRLLKGWGYDSNGPEGAVLKGWVQSRFGLSPTYHKAPLTSELGPNWATYVEEKMSSRFHNNAIHTQLDILYEFAQWALRRFVAPGQDHLTLYRGTNTFDEHQIVQRLDRRSVVMRINNLASFSEDRDVAGCFGDVIVTTQVPLSKIVFFNTLLPGHPLKGEGEYLVIGGDYLAQASRF